MKDEVTGADVFWFRKSKTDPRPGAKEITWPDTNSHSVYKNGKWFVEYNGDFVPADIVHRKVCNAVFSRVIKAKK